MSEMKVLIPVPRVGQHVPDPPATTPPELEQPLKDAFENGLKRALSIEELDKAVAEVEAASISEDLPPISEMIGSKVASFFGPILAVIAFILALPIRMFTWVVVKIKTHNYDPEKIVCPACGFKGDSGTDGKSCMIRFVKTVGNERGAIQHQCFRCGCQEIHSNLFVRADKWLRK